MSLSIRCDCCLRVDPPGIRGKPVLMGGPGDHICFDCFSEWYETGQTDPVAIRAAVSAKETQR